MLSRVIVPAPPWITIPNSGPGAADACGVAPASVSGAQAVARKVAVRATNAADRGREGLRMETPAVAEPVRVGHGPKRGRRGGAGSMKRGGKRWGTGSVASRLAACGTVWPPGILRGGIVGGRACSGSARQPSPHAMRVRVTIARSENSVGTGRRPGSNASRDRTSQVYVDLRELIVRGRLAPGTRIIETELASRLDVSRTPVRAALQRLTQEGYVMGIGSAKQMRLSVSPLTEEDARELFEIVGDLEGIAARRLARAPDAERDSLVRELRALDAELLAAARTLPPVPDRIFDLFTRFHNRLVDAGAGPRLISLHRSVKPQADRYRRLYSTTQVARIHASVHEHGVILTAIQQGDGVAAGEAVRTNWRNAADRLGEAIRRSGEMGSW
ncbi:MAG: GntR family transcriptional regulator [Gemmatimonadales bacterium]|nr:MAG: GntR family transcriptional regulator [Gemmatimonadales bacterium]